MPSMNDVLGVIMGGGRGQRIYPLTRERSKPAIPLAGKYRLIDIPISNCLHSGIHRICVLTQFNSVSLHRHIARTYVFDPFHGGWVQILAAEQTPSSQAWYQGTADAVRKQLPEIQSTEAPWILILAGDHLYRMDYALMAEFHWKNEADITVAVHRVSAQDAPRFGLLKKEADGRIVDFAEKPKEPQVLARFAVMGQKGGGEEGENAVLPEDRDGGHRNVFLGSMGIYLFRTSVLVETLAGTEDHDFGAEVIPRSIGRYRVFAYEFDGYWQDIGTIRSFFDVNLSLTDPEPPFDLWDPDWPFFTRPRFLPSPSVHGANLEGVLLGEGCRIGRAEIRRSVVGVRTVVGDGVRMRDTVVMGADYYDPPGLPPPGGVPLGIGDGCRIEGAIIDKNARLGEGVRIEPFPRGTERDGRDWVIRDGIVVVPKNTLLPPGTVIAPGGDDGGLGR